MTADEHLEWFADNIDWFDHIPVERYGTAVPACDGWTIESVINHLSFGLGLGYAVAVVKPPQTPDDQVFAGVTWPIDWPSRAAAKASFSTNMRNCLDVFRSLDPAMPTATYAGAGQAGFWFRRACVETTLHRDDVVEALPELARARPLERTVDAIAETVSFALPFGASIAGSPVGKLGINVLDTGHTFEVGGGPPVARIIGSAEHLLAALWGRNTSRVEVEGDRNVAAEWLALIERAFAGR